MREVRPAHWLRWCACCWLALSVVGCRDALGPEKMPVTTVDGSVKEGRRLLSRGWIEFIPVDGTIGRMRSARIQKDGTFHATKVAVGVHLVRLVNADIENQELRWLFGSFGSPIRRTISEKPGNRVDVDVITEYLKRAESAKKQSASQSPAPLPSQ